MTAKVFAYGSNMCSGRLRLYNVSPQGAGQAALLKEYSLCFNKRSEKDRSGKANVEPQAGGEVWGVLYEVLDADLEKLDLCEGGYRRAIHRVCINAIEVEAWVYVARNPSRDASLRPYTWYQRLLVDGAVEHALPPLYLDRLVAIEAAQDPDSSRDRKMREILCAR